MKPDWEAGTPCRKIANAKAISWDEFSAFQKAGQAGRNQVKASSR